MENIYKIKVRTNPDPNLLYPSERRYSASTVLGLGVFHIVLAFTALLLSCLTLAASRKLILTHEVQLEIPNNQTVITSESIFNLTLAPSIMCLGALAAGLTALLAWKRWYIDQNIKWFFVMSIFSTLTSSLCLITMVVIITTAGESLNFIFSTSVINSHEPSLKLVIAINVLIASFLELVWSILSMKTAYKGMINDYPEDLVFPKRAGRKQVSTVRKGNAKGRLMPPDILNHFTLGGKFSRYFPNKKENEYLPKDESYSEYQERVNRFLTSQNSITGISN